MDLRETRSNSQIPTVFPHRFPANSQALPSVEGFWDAIGAAIQATSTSKVRRVDFGGCGPLQPPKSIPEKADGRPYWPCLVMRSTFGSLLTGHAVVIYFREERW